MTKFTSMNFLIHLFILNVTALPANTLIPKKQYYIKPVNGTYISLDRLPSEETWKTVEWCQE